MRSPTEVELRHLVANYDPIKAREWKGRQRGSSDDPRTGKTRAETTQRKELAASIQSLSKKLPQLEAKIREKEKAAASENRKGKAKKERAAKERDKPKSAAEKAKAVRESEQELMHKAKEASGKSGGDSFSKKKPESKTSSVSELKALATKVKGQIAVAKQKLAAL